MAGVSALQELVDNMQNGPLASTPLVTSAAAPDAQGSAVQAASSSTPPSLPASNVQPTTGQVAQADATGTPPTPASPPQQTPAPLPASQPDPLDNIIDTHVQKSAQKDDLDHIIDNPSHLPVIDRTPIQPTGNPLLDDPMNPQHYLPASLQQSPNMGRRFLQGLTDPLVGESQLLSHALPAPAQSQTDTQQMDNFVNRRETQYKQNNPVVGPDIMRGLGEVASPANVLLPLGAIAKIGGDATGGIMSKIGDYIGNSPAIKSAMTGGTMAASQPTETEQGYTFAGAKGLQTAEGAATGGLVNKGGNTIASMIKPAVSDDAQTLLNNGIRVGTDQLSGNGGSKLTSLPIVGGMINQNHNLAIDDLNKAVLNKALNPIGEKIPATMAQSGNDAIAYTRGRLSNAYDALLPSLSGNINDQTTNTLGQRLLTDSNHVVGGDQPMNFQEKFSQLMQNKYYDMSMPANQKLGTILTKEISGVVGNDGSFTGSQFKQMETGLNAKISQYSASPDPDHRMIANALTDTKGLLKDQLAAQNPEGAQQLQNINQGYSVFKTAQRAASSTAAPNGVFNPTQLYAAVKNSDTSLDKRAFTEGTLPLYDLASAAKNVLSDYKNSGTADRGLAAAAAGSLATGGLSKLALHPVGTALGALTAGYYTQPAQATARYLMTRNSAGSGALADLVRRATDVSALHPYAQ